jgi:L-fucose isomerase-like protein
MQPEGPSLFVYIFPGILLVAVLWYFLHGAVDRMALETSRAEARVTGKQIAPGSTTYTTEVIGDGTMTRANENPEAYVVSLVVDGVETSGVVSRQLYDSIETGERVYVTVRRTRLSKRVLVTSVSR